MSAKSTLGGKHGSRDSGSGPTELIWDLGRAYYAYVGLAERVLVEEGVGEIVRPGMGLVLIALYERDGRTIKEIAERTQLANSTLTGLLNRMEKVGLVARARDPEDGRLARIALTPLGRELEPKCRAAVQRVTMLATGGLGEENAAEASAMLRTLASAFRHEEQRLAGRQSGSRSGRNARPPRSKDPAAEGGRS